MTASIQLRRRIATIVWCAINAGNSNTTSEQIENIIRSAVEDIMTATYEHRAEFFRPDK